MRRRRGEGGCGEFGVWCPAEAHTHTRTPLWLSGLEGRGGGLGFLKPSRFACFFFSRSKCVPSVSQSLGWEAGAECSRVRAPAGFKGQD